VGHMTRQFCDCVVYMGWKHGQSCTGATHMTKVIFKEKFCFCSEYNVHASMHDDISLMC